MVDIEVMDRSNTRSRAVGSDGSDTGITNSASAASVDSWPANNDCADDSKGLPFQSRRWSKRSENTFTDPSFNRADRSSAERNVSPFSSGVAPTENATPKNSAHQRFRTT